MKKIRLILLPVITYLLILISCGDESNVSDAGSEGTQITTGTTLITYLLPVFDNQIYVDTLSNDSAMISWDTSATKIWYRVYVYDSLDTINPAYVISTNTNKCAIKNKTGHTYGIQVFTVYDTILIDSSTKQIDSTRINLSYGSVYFYTDTVINYYISDSLSVTIPTTPYVVFDNSLGYYICTNPADSFTIQIQAAGADTLLHIIPDKYVPQFKIRFYTYQSPVIVEKVYPSPDSLKISWNRAVGDSVKGYRVYIRDYNGIVRDSFDIDSIADTTVFLNGNYINTLKNTGTILTGIADNNAYKINIATLSSIGPGSLNSNFILDTSDPDSNRVKLPYAYYSTYMAPTTGPRDSLTGVKGGIYLMGETWEPVDELFCPGAKPVHEVIVSSFYLGNYEVTGSQYAAFLNAVKDSITYDSINPAILTFKGVKLADTAKATWYIINDSGTYIPETGKESFPVLSLYWHGAAAYCNRLSEQDSTLTNCYDSTWEFISNTNGYRLPTEAEFEYAASGAFTGNKLRFPWGYAWDKSKAAVDGNSVVAVGSYGAYNGFYDLVGSAMEYVNDWSDELTGLFLDSSSYYVTSKQLGVMVNPTGPQQKTGYKHMMRGGSYTSGEDECVSYFRYIHPSGRLSEYGFRIARNAL